MCDLQFQLQPATCRRMCDVMSIWLLCKQRPLHRFTFAESWQPVSFFCESACQLPCGTCTSATACLTCGTGYWMRGGACTGQNLNESRCHCCALPEAACDAVTATTSSSDYVTIAASTTGPASHQQLRERTRPGFRQHGAARLHTAATATFWGCSFNSLQFAVRSFALKCIICPL